MAYQKCLTEIRKAAGVDFSDAELEAILTRIVGFKRRSDSPRLSESEQLQSAAKEISADLKRAAAIERRNKIMNLKKRVSRRRFYEEAPDVGKTPGQIIGLEAKLVGVNTPFSGSRLSVDAQYRGLNAELQQGLAVDLDKLDLFEYARRGDDDRAIAQELAELNSNKPDAEPGVTGNARARQVAGIIHKYQKQSVDGLNRAGAWIGEYDGYIARTSHDPDRIRRVGRDAWKAKILAELDAERTFADIEDPGAFLDAVYDGLVTGVHMTQDGMTGIKDPAFVGPGNLAKRLSQGRKLHFRDSDAWMNYNDDFGTGNLMELTLRALDHGARHTALMREFGTSPRAELEADIRSLTERHRGDTDRSLAIRNREKALHNRMDELDGTAMMPINRQAARIGAGWRAWQSMSKLGGVVLSALGDIPLKAAEVRYQGGNLLEGYADGFASIARGRGARGSETREIMDLLRAGTEGMTGSLADRFTGADTTPGKIAKVQNTFFRWSGLNYWTDSQRAGMEMLMSRSLAQLADRPMADLPDASRRLLDMFGIDAGKWEMLRGLDHHQANGRRYITPDLAQKIPDDQMAAYLVSRGEIKADTRPEIVAARVDQARRDLALDLHAYFTDRSEYAVLQPGARERAITRLGTRPGTPEGEGIRMLMQFKSFPVAVISRAWGREIYGGQGGFGKVAGLVHMMVAGTVFGYLALTAKDLAKGRSPRDPTDPKVWAAAFTQGGGAGIYGDFIVGEYSRFGRTLLASIAGPTFSQVDTVADLWNRVKSGDDLAAPALRAILSNAPFVNLFYSRIALDYLFLYQIQEALSPGFLKRFERTVEKQNKQKFMVRPSAAVPRGGGDRLLEGIR